MHDYLPNLEVLQALIRTLGLAHVIALTLALVHVVVSQRRPNVRLTKGTSLTNGTH